MTVYENLCESAEKGMRWRINLVKKNLYIGRKAIVKEGKTEEIPIGQQDDVTGTLEGLYRTYKTSRPSERSERKKSYLKALPLEELTDAQLVNGEERCLAQAKLEGYILCCALTDQLTIPEEHWFWKSQKEPGLVILKNWL